MANIPLALYLLTSDSPAQSRREDREGGGEACGQMALTGLWLLMPGTGSHKASTRGPDAPEQLHMWRGGGLGGQRADGGAEHSSAGIPGPKSVSPKGQARAHVQELIRALLCVSADASLPH